MGRVHGDRLPQKGDHEFHHPMESGTIMEWYGIIWNDMESYGMIWNDMEWYGIMDHIYIYIDYHIWMYTYYCGITTTFNRIAYGGGL